MNEAHVAHHMAVEDTPDRGVCKIQLKDAFLNYALADQLKRNLKDTCQERVRLGVRNFVVDLSAVNVMDSCGLSVLISLKKVLEADGGRINLAGLSPMLLRLFSITKLDRVFEIFPTEKEAIDAFAATTA